MAIKLTEQKKSYHKGQLEFHKSYLTESIGYCKDPEKNEDGHCFVKLSNRISTIAKSDYLLNSNKESFIKFHNWSGNMYFEYFNKFVANDLTYYPDEVDIVDCLFKFLSAGNIKRAAEFISITKEVDEQELSSESCCDCSLFTLYFLQKLLINKDSELTVMDKHLDNILHRMQEFPATFKGRDGYFVVFRGLLKNNALMINDGLQAVFSGHNYQCAESKLYACTYQKDFFYWGLGLVNLCRYKGINTEIESSLIFKDLIIDVNNTGEVFPEIDNIKCNRNFRTDQVSQPNLNTQKKSCRKNMSGFYNNSSRSATKKNKSL